MLARRLALLMTWVLMLGTSATVVPAGASASAADEVIVTPDLVYGAVPDEHGVTETLRLDLYDPGNLAGGHPVLVLVHGGGFSQGDKADAVVVAAAMAFARLGYVVASVNYRLRPDRYPEYPVASLDAQHDVQAAVRWLRANAQPLHLDPGRIAITGHSAGAITALRVAANPDDPGDSGTPGESSAVSAVLAVSGFLATDVASADADVLMLHGTADTLIPVGWADDTCQRWTAAGGDCDLVSYPGGTHDATGFFDPASAAVTDFLTCRVGGAMSYTDLVVGSPAADAVAWAEGRGIIGESERAFGPSMSVSRSQFATWSWKLMGRPRRAPVYLSDVATTTKAAPAIAWALSAGVLRARGDDTFGPGQSMTRSSAAMALWRLAGRPIGAPVSGLPGLDPSAKYALAVDWLADRGLTDVFAGDTFWPHAPLRRLHLVRILRGLSFDPGAWATPPDQPLCFGP